MIDVELRKAAAQPFISTDLALPGKRSGKVRDIYSLNDSQLLLVTTDRLSAFDRVLGSVPFKGQVLNQLSAFWFERTQDILPSHLISMPDPNASLVHRAQALPIEVIVRGYITGVTSTSLWYRYELGERTIYGHSLPEELRKNQALPSPLITPTTKGGPGEHDERLTPEEVVGEGYLDRESWDIVQEAALAIFRRGQDLAARAGLILVDTKYEFGRAADGRILLIDELHTADSSRYWRAESYPERFALGEEPENFDKEFVRLEYAALGYRGEGDPPHMPAEFWECTGRRYIQLFDDLTGLNFKPGDYPVEARLKANLTRAGVLA